MRISPAFFLLVAAIPSRLAGQTATADSARKDSLARYTLQRIEVTVSRSETDMARVPFAVQVLTANDIGPGRARLGLDEALAGVPGVLAANRQNYALDQTLSIRGFGARSAFGVRGLKILLDGIPQTLPDGQGQLTNVDLDDVERMEILRGSTSSLYGNASGGVISLSTQDDRPGRIAPDVRVLGGAYGLMKYHGNVDAPVGKGTLSISGARTYTDGFRTHSWADLRQGRARLSLPAAGGNLTLIAQLADDPVIKDPGALTLTEMNADPRGANPLSVSRDAGKDVTQEQGGVTFARLFGNVTTNATAFGLKRHLINPTTATFIDLGRWAWGARGSAGVPFTLGSRTALLTGGVDAQWQHDDRINKNLAQTAVTRDQLEQVAELGPFLQATIDALPSVTLLLGGRYDHHRFSVDDNFLSDGDDSGLRIMSALSGSAGIATHGSEFFAPYGNVSTSFETPTTTELANRPTGPGGFNPDLGPQKAVNFEVGVRGGVAAGGGRVDYSVALYRANITGELIPFEVPTDPTRRFYRNSGASHHQGVEAGVGVRKSVFSLRGAWTYSDNKFDDYQVTAGGVTTVYNGKEEPGVPHHFFKAVATVRTPRFGWLSVEQSASASYFVSDGNATRNPGWAATSVRGGLDLVVAGWNIGPFASVDNLFDKRYAASVQVNAAGGRFFEPSPGRTAYVGMEIRGRR